MKLTINLKGCSLSFEHDGDDLLQVLEAVAENAMAGKVPDRAEIASGVLTGLASRANPWGSQEAAGIAVTWADALIARLGELPTEQVPPGVSDPRD